MDDEPQGKASRNLKPIPPPKPTATMSVMTPKVDDLTEKFTQLEEKLRKDQRTWHEKNNLLSCEISYLRTGFTALQKDHTDLQEQHVKLKTEHSKVRQESAELKVYFEAFHADHRRVLTEQEKLKTEIHKMRPGQQTHLSDVEKLREEQRDILKQVTSMRKETTSLSHDLSNIKDTDIAQFRSELYNLSRLNQTNHDKLHEEMANIQENHSKLVEKQINFQTEVNDLKTNQGKLNTDVDTIRTVHKTLNMDMAKLQSDHRRVLTEQGQLKTELHSMRPGPQTRPSDVEKLRKEQSDILKQVTSVRKEIASQLHDLSSSKDTDIVQLRSELHNLCRLNQTNYDKLHEEMAKIQENESKLVEKYINVQNEMNDLQTDQGKLNADVDTINTVQRTLNMDMAKLQSENIDPFLAEQRLLQQNQASLTSEVAMLKADVKQTKTALEKASSAIAALETRLDQEQSSDAISAVMSSSTHTATSAALPPPTPITAPTFPPSVDMKKAKPLRLFSTSAATADDRRTPYIDAMVCLPDGRLVMTDGNNDMVKVMEVSAPHTVTASLSVREVPLCLAVLCDGHVAVTTLKPIIYLMTVTDTVNIASRIQTDRQYIGIVGHGGGHLIVSCEESSTGPTALKVLTRKGDLVRTVTDSSRLPGLVSPLYLLDAGDNHVLASDCRANNVFYINISSGQATLTHQQTDMMWPAQMCLDSAGQLYVASVSGKCVLVRDRAGQWRQLLTGRQHSDQGYVHPVGLCLTRSGHLVVSWCKPGFVSESVVICSKLE